MKPDAARGGEHGGTPGSRGVAAVAAPAVGDRQGHKHDGDGVKEYADGGTTACAETAQLVVEQILRRYPLG
jgi:hypothetical protein